MRYLIAIGIFTFVGSCLFAWCENRSCPNPAVSVTTQKSHPEPKADGDSAIVYVVTNVGRLFSPSLHMDGRFVGANKSHTYFYLVIKPGVHEFCAHAFRTGAKMQPDFLHMTAEGGQVYYLEQTVEGGFSSVDRVRLNLLRPEQGSAQVASAEYVTAQEKP